MARTIQSLVGLRAGRPSNASVGVRSDSRTAGFLTALVPLDGEDRMGEEGPDDGSCTRKEVTAMAMMEDSERKVYLAEVIERGEQGPTAPGPGQTEAPDDVAGQVRAAGGPVSASFGFSRQASALSASRRWVPSAKRMMPFSS
jgi:hypothetical protein